MAEVSEAAKVKALELARIDSAGRGASKTDGHYYADMHTAFARYIERVSDAAKAVVDELRWSELAQQTADVGLAPFMLSDPVDPLQEILSQQFPGVKLHESTAGIVHRELAKRGLKIVEAQS